MFGKRENVEKACVLCKGPSGNFEKVCYGSFGKKGATWKGPNNTMTKQGDPLTLGYANQNADAICENVGGWLMGEQGWSGNKSAYPFGKTCDEKECAGICEIPECPPMPKMSTIAGAIIKNMPKTQGKMKQGTCENYLRQGANKVILSKL